MHLRSPQRSLEGYSDIDKAVLDCRPGHEHFLEPGRPKSGGRSTMLVIERARRDCSSKIDTDVGTDRQTK